MNFLELQAIPWMKHRIEIIYDAKINGNLFVLYLNKKNTNFNFDDYAISYLIQNLFIDNNILVDSLNSIHCYFPFDIDENTKNIAISIKELFKENCKIFFGSYNENLSMEDINYKSLENITHANYYIQNDKSYELFTSIFDTQSLKINLNSCVSLCGCLEHDIKSKNITHISFVNLFDNSCSDSFENYYLKGLVNVHSILGYSI